MTALAAETFPAGPMADGRDRDYWEALEAGRFVVQRCGSCDAWLPGCRVLCPHCHGFDLPWEPVAAKGRVFTWCRTHHPYMSELADLLPYVSLVVELPGAGGVRVLGMLDPDSEPSGSGIRSPASSRSRRTPTGRSCGGPGRRPARRGTDDRHAGRRRGRGDRGSALQAGERPERTADGPGGRPRRLRRRRHAAYLRTDYREIVPGGEPLGVRAWIESEEGRKRYMRAELAAGS